MPWVVIVTDRAYACLYFSYKNPPGEVTESTVERLRDGSEPLCRKRSLPVDCWVRCATLFEKSRAMTPLEHSNFVPR
jgi:hypothetical protein